MDRGTGDRAVSEVVGFILIFGMLVIAFTVYQGIVVPDQNRQVEFQHNQEVQGQLQDLRNAIIRTSATGSGEAVSITLGATYPRRTIALNLGVSSGALSTREIGDGIQIDNVRATDSETRDFIDGSLGPYSTKDVQYRPTYTFYRNAPVTRYENTIAYNQFADANLTLTDQVMVDGRRITVIVLNGSLSRAQRGTVSVSTEAISTSPTRIAVENTSDARITLTIPTRLPASAWEEALAEELGGGGSVVDVSPVADEPAVRITLRQGPTYELRIAKVGLGSGTTEEGPAYLTDVEGDDVSVPEGGTQKLVVEVRDRLNNPVSSVQVTQESHLPPVGTVSPSSVTTGPAGHATFIYDAPDNVNNNRDIDVTVSIEDGSPPAEVVTFDVRVLDTDTRGPPA